MAQKKDWGGGCGNFFPRRVAFIGIRELVKPNWALHGWALGGTLMVEGD